MTHWTRDAEGSRVVLLCGVGTGNVGNDESLRTAVRLMTSARPGLRLLVATPFPDGARELLDLPVMPMRQNMSGYRALPSRAAMVRAIICGEFRRLRDIHRVIRRSSLLVVTGTGIFDDFGEHPWNMPYALLTWTAAARLARRPFAFMSVGAGPVHDEWSKRLFVIAARLATSVSYRDAGSMEFMAGIGAGRRDARIVPDLVFATPRPEALAARPSAVPLVVGVGVMDYGGWSVTGRGPIYEAYVRCIVDVVTTLLHEGHTVRFLVGQPCDLPVVSDVIRRCGEDAREVLEVPDIPDFPALLEAVGQTDLVVATRYHNLVAAVMMGRPVVSLSYAPKNAELLASIGIHGFDRPIEEATADWVLNRVEEIRDGRSGFDLSAWNTVDEWSRIVGEEVDRVLQSAGLDLSLRGLGHEASTAHGKFG